MYFFSQLSRDRVRICGGSRPHTIVFFCPALGEIFYGNVVWQSPEDSGVASRQGVRQRWGRAVVLNCSALDNMRWDKREKEGEAQRQSWWD